LVACIAWGVTRRLSLHPLRESVLFGVRRLSACLRGACWPSSSSHVLGSDAQLRRRRRRRTASTGYSFGGSAAVAATTSRSSPVVLSRCSAREHEVGAAMGRARESDRNPPRRAPCGLHRLVVRPAAPLGLPPPGPHRGPQDRDQDHRLVPELPGPRDRPPRAHPEVLVTGVRGLL
jgi:hypothetical protein